MTFRARAARPSDATAIARIYNEGIADRVATFETELRTAEDIAGWFGGRHPVIVVDGPDREPVAFAAGFPYRPSRAAYAGIAEFSVYVARSRRGHGVGRIAMEALIGAATERGFWKLVSRIFPENAASRALLRQVGFREVGVYRRHAQLDGQWRDVVIVERLLGSAADDGGR